MPPNELNLIASIIVKKCAQNINALQELWNKKSPDGGYGNLLTCYINREIAGVQIETPPCLVITFPCFCPGGCVNFAWFFKISALLRDSALCTCDEGII